MKLFYNFLFVLSIMITPFALQSQDDPYDGYDPYSNGDEWWEDFDDGCPLPCSEIFISMEEVFGDGSNGDGSIAANTVEDPGNPCPSSKSMTVKVKVTINAPTGTAAKDSLEKWKATYEGTPAMDAALKKKFKCADCGLPGIGKCPQSVSDVKITWSNPTGTAGNYKATITVKFKANCGDCPLLIFQPGSNSIANSLVSIFPNPGNHTLNVNIKLSDIKSNIQFRILDMTGKLVKTVNTTPTSKLHKQDIEILNLEDGMYFLECTQGDMLREVVQFTKIK